MKLNLEKPLAFFDIETTSLDIATAKIIEISILKIHVDGKEEIYTQRINPGEPIPEKSTQVHGITNEDVENQPTFKEVAKEIANFFGKADLAGYNIFRFDLPVLSEEFYRAGIEFELENRNIIDVQNIFHKMEPRTLKAAYKFYCNAELEDAHSSLADTIATYKVLLAQIEKYKNVEYIQDNKITYPIQNNIKMLSEFSVQKRFVDLAGNFIYDDDNVVIVNFGKHKGKPLEEVLLNEPQYYDWICKSNFPENTKMVCRKFFLKVLENKLKNK